MQNIIALIAADLAETGEMIRMTCTTDGDSFRAQLEDDTGCVLFDSQGDKALAAEGVSLATAIAKLDALCAMPYVGRLSAPAL